MSKTIEAKVELDKTRDAMLALGLEYGAASLPELISNAVKDELAPHRLKVEVRAHRMRDGDPEQIAFVSAWSEFFQLRLERGLAFLKLGHLRLEAAEFVDQRRGVVVFCHCSVPSFAL